MTMLENETYFLIRHTTPYHIIPTNLVEVAVITKILFGLYHQPLLLLELELRRKFLA